MPVYLILPVSITLSLLAWLLIARWYIWPEISRWTITAALKPLILFHCFRYVGLMFLVPGVTTEALDPRFADPAAYGDLIAALLAFAALAALHINLKTGLLTVWLFNIWGLLDLLNAVARGILYTPDGHLGATFWIPATIVPFLVMTHVLIFILLIRRNTVTQEGLA